MADEGQRDAGERDEPGHAAHDDERLQHDDRGEAHGRKRAHVAFRARRRHEPADGEAQEQKQHAGCAQKADLFGDVGEDEVALYDGDLLGQAVAQPHAEQVAVGNGVDGLGELVAGVLRVGERIEPGVHAHLHVVERQKRAHAAHGDEAQSDGQIELLAGGHVQHDEEHEEQNERAAEVLFKHHDEQRDAPHEDERQQRADVGQPEGPHAHGEHREHLAVLRKVARKEQHDDDLGDLAWLEREPAQAQPDAAAVYLLAQARHKR